MKQRHTAKRVFERLRDEQGFAGGYTVVKDHVRICRARGRETFVPLAHPPGHAQVDFGEAIGVIGGVRQKGSLPVHGPAAVGCLLREGETPIAPRIWPTICRQPGTLQAWQCARRQMLRALVADTADDVDEAVRDVVLTIHWRGGRHSNCA